MRHSVSSKVKYDATGLSVAAAKSAPGHLLPQTSALSVAIENNHIHFRKIVAFGKNGMIAKNFGFSVPKGLLDVLPVLFLCFSMNYR